MVEDALVAAIERHLLAKNGLTARHMAITDSSRASGDSGEWLRAVLSRCSLPLTGRTDPEDVSTTDTTSASSSSTSSLTTFGQ